jgi:hypothetical protein
MWSPPMTKALVIFGLSIAVAFPAATAATSNNRTFEECQQIAVSRGIPIKRAHPDRYVMLKGIGEKTDPKGFMARCMSGKQV